MPKAERPISADFRGELQVNGFSGYEVLADRDGVRRAFYWAHVRRRFYELAQAGCQTCPNSKALA